MASYYCSRVTTEQIVMKPKTISICVLFVSIAVIGFLLFRTHFFHKVSVHSFEDRSLPWTNDAVDESKRRGFILAEQVIELHKHQGKWPSSDHFPKRFDPVAGEGNWIIVVDGNVLYLTFRDSARSSRIELQLCRLPIRFIRPGEYEIHKWECF